MNVDRLRKNKTKAISRLSKEGISIRQIAILLYNEDSERAQSRVRALLSKLRKKKLSSFIARERAGAQPQPFEAQPQPEEQEESPEAESATIEDKAMEGPNEPGVVKYAETVEKGKAADTVLSWLDEDALARQLADECYEKARRCYEERDYENAFRFMELVTRFLKLSQTARKEYDLEELKKVVEEEYGYEP
ncbi:MAG: hypothetical protein QXU32_04680 [Nitrososphaerales archaeon]